MAGAFTIKPLTALRKVIAARMIEAKRTIPHFRLTSEIELDALLCLRKELQASYPEEKLSINDLLIKACAIALTEVPGVNIQWVDTAIHEYRDADISVVIAVPGGLATPVVRRANTKTVFEISREVKELAARAQKNALKMDEIIGGSFSISNLGMYGVDQFDAVINPPQCAILAVGRGKSVVVVGEGGQPRVATVLNATLSLDHRAIDGPTGGEFLRAVSRAIETPDARMYSSAVDD